MKMFPGAVSVAFLVVAGFVGALLADPRPAESQGASPPARVAFVDVAEVFKKYKRSNDIQIQFKSELQAVDKGLQERFNEMKRRRADLEILVAGTQEYVDQKRQLDIDAFMLEYDEKEQKRTIMEGAVTRMNGVYTEIRREAENYARRNGFHCVLMNNASEIQARTLEELQVLIASRPVLYRDKSMDITETILEILNKQ